jgi:hypothetical protein
VRHRPSLIAWLQRQVRRELMGDPVGFGAARRTPPTEPGESKPRQSGVSHKQSTNSASQLKQRQLQNRVTNTGNTTRARPRQLIIIAPGNYFIIAPRNPQKQTPFDDGKDIAIFSALNLAITSIISFCHIADKLLDEGEGK